MALVDHYRSNASALWAVNGVADDGVAYNGGSRYLPKTDGRRNDCFERLFLTVSPRFEEVLPNIPNPKSPWMHVAGERLWSAHGASNREHDYALWKKVARYGMTKMVDHRPRDRLARRRRELHVPHPGRAGQGRRRGPGRLRPQDPRPGLPLRHLQQLHRLRPGQRVLERGPA